MEHLAPIHQVGVQRAQPLSIRPLRRDTGVVDQCVKATIQLFLDDPNGIYRIGGVGQIQLHVIFASTAPWAFFGYGMTRTGNDPPTFKIEPAHGCVTNPTAGSGQKKCLLSFGHDPGSHRLVSAQPYQHTDNVQWALAWRNQRSNTVRHKDNGMKTQDMNRDWIATARTLSQALPYLQRYTGATVVIKFGGNAMGDDEEMASFARDIVLMRQVGVKPVVVHGGGPMINAMLDRLQIKSEFVNGKRVTDAATVEVVEMVLSGAVNKRIVQAINAEGGKAVGLSGKDAGLVTCDQTNPDLGFVGTPVDVNVSILRDLAAAEAIPVIAPLGAGRNGETYNINGDTMAGAIAAGLKADRLLLLTDVEGVKNADGAVLTQLTPTQIRDMTASGVIAGGMIPKTETALAAIEGGVRAVVILDGRAPNACLLELYTDHGAGSLIRA